MLWPFLPFSCGHVPRRGPRFHAVWSEPPRMAGEEWGALQGGSLLLPPQKESLIRQKSLPEPSQLGGGRGLRQMTGS